MNLLFKIMPIHLLICVAALTASAQSATPFVAEKMNTVLYGVAYYAEYMPYERLNKDVELMQNAGINVVPPG
jgi:beta-galactosidase